MNDTKNVITNIVENLKFSTLENAIGSEALQNLNNNLQQLSNLKQHLMQVFLDYSNKLTDLNEKLKNCKYNHSKVLYSKKAKKMRANCVDLLYKMEQTDKSISNLKSTKNKLAVEALNNIQENSTEKNEIDTFKVFLEC